MPISATISRSRVASQSSRSRNDARVLLPLTKNRDSVLSVEPSGLVPKSRSYQYAASARAELPRALVSATASKDRMPPSP